MKKLYIFLIIFLFSIFLVPRETYASNIFPSLPIDESYPYVISIYDLGEVAPVKRIYLTYCKNSSYKIKNKQQNEIGICLDENGNNMGYASRRSINYTDSDITMYDVINYSADFSNFSWSNEQNGNSYGTSISYDTNLNRYTYIKDYENQTLQTISTIITTNTNIYGNNNVILFDKDLVNTSSEPTYSMTKNILENGDAKLTFEFQNYSSDSNYTFEIENRISGEYYGIANPYSSIFPNIIPYGESFEITLSYDSVLYITLAQYNQLEDSELYYREEIYTDYIDINNIVFENNEDPYFSVILQTKNTIAGNFHNTKPGQSCYYRNSNSNIIKVITCDEQQVYETFDFNGYIEFYIENSNGDTIYNRKINVLGGNLEQPYITYYVTKQDFYSLINWSVENYTPNNIYYRYSIDNGSNFTSWSLLSQKDNKLNIFENSTTIIEISDSNQNTIYDKKAIYVVNSINTITEFNNTTNNFINKFSNLFTPNQNILKNVNDYWTGIRNSKLYFLIFIPFITSLICAIIHLIRRK